MIRVLVCLECALLTLVAVDRLAIAPRALDAPVASAAGPLHQAAAAPILSFDTPLISQDAASPAARPAFGHSPASPGTAAAYTHASSGSPGPVAANTRGTAAPKPSAATTGSNALPVPANSIAGGNRWPVGPHFDSVRRPAELTTYCRRQPASWIFDEGRSGVRFCGSILASNRNG